MREINVSTITDVVEKLCIDANTHLPDDVKCAIKNCRKSFKHKGYGSFWLCNEV